jgi:hypothetical protein
MQQGNKSFCAQFEIEVWLYISGELNDERKKSWKLHLEQCPECSALLESNKELSAFYSENMSEDLLDSVFDKAVEKATAKLSLAGWFRFYIKSMAKSFAFGKIVLGGSLVTASIIIMFLSQRPNPVKQISDSISKWEDTTFTTKVEEISKSILSLDQSANRSDAEWAKSVNGIENQLDSLKNNINN